MRLSELEFKRKFCINPYKELRMDVARMNMYKDWVNDTRGDPYPLYYSEGSVSERVSSAKYSVSSDKGGRVSRVIGGFMPIYTYEFKIRELEGASMGFEIVHGENVISVMLADGENAVIRAGSEYHEFDCKARKGDVCSATFREGGVSLYIKRELRPELICDVSLKALEEFSKYEVFSSAKACLVTAINSKGRAAYSDVSVYLCGGISHADIRPMKYEDGTPIFENGRVYLTVSSRLETGGYQSVMSLDPTACDLRLEGAMLFDTGDGYCRSDVASSVVYDRSKGVWYLWYCSFSHDHILARAEVKGDPRFGIQIIDSRLLPPWKGEDRREFAGIWGDEDPDLCFIDGKWNLTVCRLEEDKAYHYYRFVSDSPLDGFVFADRTPTGGKTGGMMTLFENEYYFTCGTDFNSRALYDIYKYDDFSAREHIRCDYDDGGFRGWGTVFGVNIGTRRRYFFLTFDRHNGSGWNWSYGNIYLFEADKYFKI